MNEATLSVIIPCKNEEQNIARCLHSVIKEVEYIKNAEIMLVDCASTDKTIEIVKQFPVNIIQLKPNWVHSPAAAKYLGCLNTDSKYIFTIDADMELLPGFLKKAVEFLEKDEKVAGCAGMGSEIYQEGGKLDDLYKRNNKLQAAPFLGGAALYRRTALKVVGYFNPYFQAEEEMELCQRLIKTGFKLFSLPFPMTIHYSSRSIRQFFKRRKAGLFLAPGQLLRQTFLSGNFLFHLSRFKEFISFICLMVIAIVTNSYILLSKNIFLLTLEAIAIVLFWLSICLMKKSFKAGTLSIFKWININMNIIAGMMMKPKDPRTYPQDPIVIRKGIKIDYQ